jgi:DNA-3-methyladenine glycosylase
MSRLSRSFFDRSPLEVAPDLLGCVVSHGGVAVRLTEVEAYAGARDPGSHAFRGRTARNAVMFGEPGHVYLYFTYGMHTCANLVCWPAGRAGAVLLRAGEVVEGHDLARQRRATARRSGAPVADRDLARGPARLVQALGLRLEDNGLDACRPGSPLTVHAPGWVSEPPERAAYAAQARRQAIRTGPRVGLSGPGGDGATYPWRFWLDGEPTVSSYRPALPRRRPPQRA